MKRITPTALFTLAVLVTAALVPGTGAMAQGRAVRATVPFDFTIGDKLLPAGTYEIWSPSTGTIEVQNRDKHVAMLTTTTYDSHESRNSTLVFDKYGDQYFSARFSAPRRRSMPACLRRSPKSRHACSRPRCTMQARYL